MWVPMTKRNWRTYNDIRSCTIFGEIFLSAHILMAWFGKWHRANAISWESFSQNFIPVCRPYLYKAQSSYRLNSDSCNSFPSPVPTPLSEAATLPVCSLTPSILTLNEYLQHMFVKLLRFTLLSGTKDLQVFQCPRTSFVLKEEVITYL